jgi:hypothetical protein
MTKYCSSHLMMAYSIMQLRRINHGGKHFVENHFQVDQDIGQVSTRRAINI